MDSFSMINAISHIKYHTVSGVYNLAEQTFAFWTSFTFLYGSFRKYKFTGLSIV